MTPDWGRGVSIATRDRFSNLLPSWRQQRQVCAVLLDQPGDYPICKGADQLQPPWKASGLPRDAITAAGGKSVCNSCRLRRNRGASGSCCHTKERRGQPWLSLDDFINSCVHDVLLTRHYRRNGCWAPVTNWKMNRKGRIRLAITGWKGRPPNQHRHSCPPIPTGILPSIFPIWYSICK